MDSMPESLMQLATEIVETPVVETTTTGVETPVLETVESVVAEVETATVKEESPEDSSDYVAQFLQGIGYEGDPLKGDTIEDLITAAKTTTEKYKEKAEFYESNKVIKELAEHIQLGGDPADYFAQPQESNVYQNLKLEDDDVDNREQLFRIAYEGKVDEEMIQLLIDRSKEKGTFNADSDKLLEKFKAEEVLHNEGIVATREQERAAVIEQRKTFIAEVSKGFDEGMTGITVSPEILQKAKSLSLPDAKGNFGISEKINNLTPREEAVLNTFIVALTEKKAFQFNPTKAVVTGVINKPIHQLFNKESSGGGSKVSTEDVGAVLNNALQKLKQN